jgi:UTP--glucose-1-phosphate uridylyltransferase
MNKNNQIKPVKKAIFPVAGIGSRFLPATKATPKEMLPIVDKPLIQYAVEEAIASGIEELIFITSYNKRAIEDHFDKNIELENLLLNSNKLESLQSIKNIIPKHITCIYLRQSQPLGLGHAIYCAKRLIQDEPVAILLADDLITPDNNTYCLAEMIEYYYQTQASIIAVEKCPQQLVHNYGIVGTNNNFAKFGKINSIVEKPTPANAPSNLAVIGRYILTPEIFRHIQPITSISANNPEIQLTTAINSLLSQEDAYALKFSGHRYDCGQKLGYLKATIDLALQHPKLGKDLFHFLNQKVSDNV